MKQSELAAWFLETYSFPISQPTISHSLKKSAEIIARGISTPGLEPTRVRRRPVRHPELEQALFQWVQQQQQEQGPEQSGEGSDPISGPALVRQAKKIAQEMDIHDTVFCPGWLSRFKVRYGMTPSRGSSQPENHHRHHHHNHSHHPHHSHPPQRRHRHCPLPEQQQQQLHQQQQQQPQPEFEPSIQTVSSITISNHSCSPPPSENYSMPQNDSVTPRSTTLDSSALGTIEIRPSIAVPASIDSSHSSLQPLRPQHTGFGSVHILPSSGDLDRQSLHHQRQQHLQQQQQQQQQDAQLLQQFRMQTYQPPTSRTTHLHPHNQQRQQNQQTLTDFQAVSAVSSSSSPSVATSTSEITAAMHLEFLQSIPITTPTNGTGSLLQVPSSLPPSPLSHHTPGSLLRSPNDPFQSSSIVAARAEATTVASSSPSSMGGSKLDSGISLGKVQTLHEAQRLVQLLRQYAGSHLQDPTGALKNLESLEWELDPTRMRGSITISEMGDDQD